MGLSVSSATSVGGSGEPALKRGLAGWTLLVTSALLWAYFETQGQRVPALFLVAAGLTFAVQVYSEYVVLLWDRRTRPAIAPDGE
jgi:hypothetical protein